MANLKVAPQRPTKLIRKYKLVYHLANGDFQELLPSVSQEGVVDSATALLGDVLSPTSSVSKITIEIGNNSNTA